MGFGFAKRRRDGSVELRLGDDEREPVQPTPAAATVA